MNNIRFIDLNASLVDKVSALGIAAEHGDYFRKSLDVPHHVLMTASNPQFSFGGGIDAKFYEFYPFCCQFKQILGGRNERIGNICFAITVDGRYRATKEIVRDALQFAMTSLLKGETLVFSGVGTGIGGLSEEDFISVLKELIPPLI